MSFKKQMKVLLIFDSPFEPSADFCFEEEFKKKDWKAERGVREALIELGHEVTCLGLYRDVFPLVSFIKNNSPDVVFNLTEIFSNNPVLDMNVVALLELIGIPYTGCSSAGMLICKNKALAKELLSFHQINTPQFAVIKLGKRILLPKKIHYPVLVKPLKEEASYGVSLNSLVDDEKDYISRVRYVHETFHTDALVEEYMEGRELYVSLIGNLNLEVFSCREMVFEGVPEDEPKFATFKAKWDEKYRQKWGIKNRFAHSFSEGVMDQIVAVCREAYDLLQITGYGRMDLRLTPDNTIMLIEANPNPHIAPDEDFALSALKSGLTYSELIQKILKLAFDR